MDLIKRKSTYYIVIFIVMLVAMGSMLVMFIMDIEFSRTVKAIILSVFFCCALLTVIRLVIETKNEKE